MTDRTRLTVLDATDTVKTALKLYLDEGFSRFPVVRDNDKDDVVGYVYAYDIVEQSNEGNNASLSRLIRAIITVPESMPIQDILQLMIQKHTPIVLVVDEYGGTSGIVTDKDIYEELLDQLKMKSMTFLMNILSEIRMAKSVFQGKPLYMTLKDFIIKSLKPFKIAI